MCCRPTVAFDVGGISEWLRNGETGYLIPSGNFSAMWGKIEELLNSREKIRKFGIQAGDFVVQKFSMKKHVTRLKEIFQEVIDMKMRERQL
jgi:glycosyltransferase involved in cell wall biosynthesis